MSKVRELHNNAMLLAEKALVARRDNNSELSIECSKKAFLLETDAAKLIPNDLSSEPTRSILYCSAASLAFEAKEYEAAKRLAIQGLAGYPSKRIEKELTEIFEKVSFEDHLILHDVSLDAGDFQFTLQGNAVSNGFIFYDCFKKRFEALQTLIEKTTQRLMGYPFKNGSIPRDAKPFMTGLSVPQTGSYAVTVRLAYKENQQNSLFVTPEEVINEVIYCVDEINNHNEMELSKHITDKSYYLNFLSNTKILAPDGEEIRGVGLVKRDKKTGLLRKNIEISLSSQKEEVIEKITRLKPVTIQGIIDFASARPNNTECIGLTSDDSKTYKLRADEGLDDYVRSFYKQQVIVTGSYDGEYIYITELNPINP